MCRNHSHLTVEWVEEIVFGWGAETHIGLAQPLTLDYPDGRKLTFQRGLVFSVPSLALVGSLLSAQLPTGGRLDSSSLWMEKPIHNTDTV